jgi:hypothetical protein
MTDLEAVDIIKRIAAPWIWPDPDEPDPWDSEDAWQHAQAAAADASWKERE